MSLKLIVLNGCPDSQRRIRTTKYPSVCPVNACLFLSILLSPFDTCKVLFFRTESPLWIVCLSSVVPVVLNLRASSWWLLSYFSCLSLLLLHCGEKEVSRIESWKFPSSPKEAAEATTQGVASLLIHLVMRISSSIVSSDSFGMHFLHSLTHSFRLTDSECWLLSYAAYARWNLPPLLCLPRPCLFVC